MSRRYFARNLGNNTAFDNAYATFLNTLDAGGEPEPLKQIQDFSKSELFFLQNAGFSDLINIPQGNFDDEVPSIIGDSLTVTGGGNGSLFDKDGILQTGLTNNRPRVTFNPENGVYEGVYVEKESENKVANSNSYLSSGYYKLPNTSIFEDSETSPDGSENASRVTMPSGGGSLFNYEVNVSYSSLLFSLYLKNNEGELITVGYSDNFSSGFTTSSSPFTPSSKWGRYSFNFNSFPTGVYKYIGLDNNGNASIVDTFMYGWQIEEDVETSYISTEGVATTRPADTYTATGAISGSSYGIFTRDQLGKRIDYFHDGNKYTYRNGTLGSTVIEAPSTDLVISSYTGSDKIKTIALRLGTMSEYELKVITSL